MTVTKTNTLQEELESANPNTLADALRLCDLGKMLAPVKVVCTGLTAAASFDITTAAVKAAATVSGVTLETGEMLPAILSVTALRCTASGTANSVGSYIMSDAGGTAVSPTAGANVGIALLSDDGKTITFPTTVTAFVLEYCPRSKTALTSAFART